MVRIVLAIAALLVMAPIAGVAGAVTAPAAAGDVGPQGAQSSDIIDTPTENISVWEHTPFTLRADAEAGATTVDNQQLRVQPHGSEQGTQLDYPKLAVYDNESAIPIAFNGSSTHDISQFENKNATVVFGKFTGDSDTNTSALPSTMSAFETFLSSNGIDELNGNVTFAEGGSPTITDTGFSGEFTPAEDGPFGDGVGQYVVFAAVNETSDTAPEMVTDENLTPSGDTVIVGAEALTVQDTNSETTHVDGSEPGDDVTFDADAMVGADGSVHHTIALYHEETFAQSGTLINLTAPLDADFSTDDVSVEPELSGVNGNVTLQNVDWLEGASASTTGSSTDVVSYLGAQSDAAATEEGTLLDGAAVTKVAGNVSEELTVETRGNWTEGDYRWIHVAGTDGGELATDTGTVTIEESGGGGGIPPAPPGGGGDADISLTDTGVSTTSADLGESYEITATYENTGDASGSHVAELTRDGSTVETKVVSLDAGETTTVTFSDSRDSAGTYDYAVDGTSAGSVVVGGEASFAVSDAAVSDTDVDVGDTVTVTATVENTGATDGTYTAELRVDGSVEDTTEITLGAGESGTVTFEYAFADTGTYDVSVGDASAGTVEVSEAGGDGIPGFGPLAALVAMAATLAVARRRAN
ncbi:CARDB domain-containing protein [Halovivax cerinus]|uniref:CARDB domain-containing protein n=1 Tax=Halovivax cerinus TaxID=1487865 RepID=A0ABD5NPX5_9EURY|nr:CARDB domain-containing protein [Halovivax cerinus]